jgi:hypothetical protein
VTARACKGSVVLERGFQDAVVDLARLNGWRTAHFRPALTQKGWRTPVAADGAGFPDLILARGPRLVVAELKRESGKTSGEQDQWLDAFAAVAAMNPLVEVHVWRPSDWDTIAATLSRSGSGRRADGQPAG